MILHFAKLIKRLLLGKQKRYTEVDHEMAVTKGPKKPFTPHELICSAHFFVDARARFGRGSFK
jgi:hypothetical protein